MPELSFNTTQEKGTIVVAPCLTLGADDVVAILETDRTVELHLAAKPGVDAIRAKAALTELVAALRMEEQ